jgi:hypothetical protein
MRAALVTTASLFQLLACGAMAAQAPDWLFPDPTLLPALKGGAKDPATQGHLVNAWHNPTAFGPGVSGELAISQVVPVARLAGSSSQDALVVGLEGAAFARFSLQVITGSACATITPAATWVTSTSAVSDPAASSISRGTAPTSQGMLGPWPAWGSTASCSGP